MTVQNPHDKFFRNSFSRREILDSFIEAYLPPEIGRAIKMDSIELLSESYVDEGLKDHQTDLLYTAQLDIGDNIYLYLLFEHKSFRDKLVAVHGADLGCGCRKWAGCAADSPHPYLSW